jgi:hypothetical protein
MGTPNGAVGRLMRMRYCRTQKGRQKSSAQATEIKKRRRDCMRPNTLYFMHVLGYTQCHNREDSNICATDSKESTFV